MTLKRSTAEQSRPGRSGRGSVSRTGRRLYVGMLVTTFTVAACGSTPSTQASPAPTSAPAEPVTSAASATTSAPPPAPDFGLVAQHATMNATDNDGYQATIDIKWHEIRQLDAGSLFASCHDMFVVPAQGGIPTNKVFHASVVEASATFPATNGFTWPDSKSLTISLEKGNGDSLEGLSVTTCTEGTPSSDSGVVPTDLSPRQPSRRYMFVDSADKTPDNPSGASKTDTLIKSSLSLVDLTVKKCSGTGLDDVMSPSLCRVSYPH